jgi:ABC-type branched-subunit amino acid transport system permease subunit
MDIFRLNLVGKYLTYAFVAVGLVMRWGYGGVLSLGQGVFFGLGGYAMAMFLKLEASDPESTKIQSTPGIPDFMDWNQITALPALWEPFKHLPFALFAVVAVPMLLAFIVSYAMFKRRVGGVYFSIITQAVALILTVLIIVTFDTKPRDYPTLTQQYYRSKMYEPHLDVKYLLQYKEFKVYALISAFLLAAVNTAIDTPDAVHVFHCIPPSASNIAYSSVVLELTILHSRKNQVTFRADAFQTMDAKLDGRVQRAARLQAVLNGDWREPVLAHY